MVQDLSYHNNNRIAYTININAGRGKASTYLPLEHNNFALGRIEFQIIFRSECRDEIWASSVDILSESVRM